MRRLTGGRRAPPLLTVVQQPFDRLGTGAARGGAGHQPTDSPGCRVKPLREGDAALLADFDAFFAGAAVVVALTREVIDRGTGLRAR